MAESEELLRRYAEERCEAAFGQLVERHISLVYSAALRQVGCNTEMARDIVQIVFMDLARKAKWVVGRVPVAGWLYRHTHFTAAKAVRAEKRRQTREQEATVMRVTDSQQSAWRQLAPVLDEAMNALGNKDRCALLLRFFEGRDLRSVGETLGINEDAAQKRVSRALEKLRRLLLGKGVAMPVGTLAALLATDAISTAAPLGLAATVAGTSIGAATAATSFTLGKILLMANLKTIAVGTIVVAGIVTPIIIQQKTISKLRNESASLRRELLDANAGAPAAAAETKPSTGDVDRAELLRLRGEAARWRGQQQEFVRLQQENQRLRTAQGTRSVSNAPNTPPMPDYLPRENWSDVGYDTPQAALQTLAWAIANGNADRFKQSIMITDRARQYLTDLLKAMHPQALEIARQNGLGVEEGLLFPMVAQDKKEGFKAFRTNSQSSPSPDELVLEMDLETNAGNTHKENMRFVRNDNQWKRLLDVEDLPVAQNQKPKP